MTEELKVIISANDSRFQKAIKNVQNSIKNIKTNNLNQGFDGSTQSLLKFQKQFERAMGIVDKEAQKTAKNYRKVWETELEKTISITEMKLQYLSKQFEQSGYADYWGTQIDESDAYLRKLNEFKKAIENGTVEIDTGALDEVANTLSSIDNMDIRMKATVDLDMDSLSQSESILKAIESALNQIDEIKIDPITPQSMALIKQYRKLIEQLISQWGKLNKMSTKPIALSGFQTQQPELYGRYQQTANIKPEKDNSRAQQLKSIGGTVAKAMIGVRGLYMLVRKIVTNNEKLTASIQYATEVIAAGLKPVLDFIASLIIGFFGILSRLFNIQVGVGRAAAATASNTEKALTIASFDELDVLNGSRDGGAGVDGGYGGYLDEINKKLERVYGLIDKIRAWVKDNLPGGKYTTETGVPRVTEQASQTMHGGTSSLGYNLVPDGNGGFIDLYEVEQNVEKYRALMDKIKEKFAELKENWKTNSEAISQNTLEQGNLQVTNWKNTIEKVKNFFIGLGERAQESDASIIDSNVTAATNALQAWQTFKEGASQKWSEFKDKVFGENGAIHQNMETFKTNVSNIWTNIRDSAIEKWDTIKTNVTQKLEDMKTKIKSVPDALKDWGTTAWNHVKNFANNIITGVESAVNNIIWKINNSGLANALNRIFDGGFYLNPIYIPRLASGGVLTTPTIAEVGEYPGAHNNPEIVTPQSLLKETIDASNGELATVFAQGIRQIISAIDNKDLEVNISDTTIAKSAARGNRSYQLATGQSLF